MHTRDMFYPPNTQAIDIARHNERCISRDYRTECLFQRQVQETCEQTRLMHVQAQCVNDLVLAVTSIGLALLEKKGGGLDD